MKSLPPPRFHSPRSPLVAIAAIAAATCQAGARVGEFTDSTDVGAVKIPGSTVHDAAADTYTLTGSGYNMWFDHDEFHYAYQKMRGDFIARAEARFVGEGVDPHRKAGWLVRESLEGNARHVNASLHGDGLMALQYRREPGAETEHVESPDQGPDVIQLERRGNTFILSTARFGEVFTTVEVEVDLPEEIFLGLCISSHNAEVAETVVFRNVRIIRPAPDDLVQYRDYLGSRLEILDLETGQREIVHTESDSLQAPNWTPDGRFLIYNRNGLLYNFNLFTKGISVLDTGFANRNNNDHVLSFDGTRIAISHHAEDADGRSIIYTLPVTGGEPTRVTEHGPSYLHGWSPDGNDLVYTAGRNGAYNIYRIPSDGGEEEALTDTAELNDGPEYSPDGKYIYFNSVRSGLMQIWRMKADGSEPEQLTDDGFNNWFPHLSPDGKTVIFLSFRPEDVNPSEHPFYQQVYLRTMPAEGGDSRVVAYVYGGQGTINVPSWSPDGRRVAFVSNTLME